MKPFFSKPAPKPEPQPEPVRVEPKVPRIIDYKTHCETLVELVRKTNMRFHPNDQARFERIIGDLENG